MVVASQYDLIPYSSEWLPVPTGNAEHLPTRHDAFQGELNQNLMRYEPYVPRPKILNNSNSIYTANSKLSSIGMLEVGALIDVYA